MEYMQYVIGWLALFAISFYVFRRYNMGLARNSRGQQLRRYLMGSLLSVATVWAAQRRLLEPPMVMAGVAALLWICTYNVLYDKSYRKCSPDYDNHMDIAFGIYLYGWLVGVGTVASWLSPTASWVVMSVVEMLIVLIPIVQIGYYMIYKTCVDNNGMQVTLETNLGEIVEFARSFSWTKLVAMTLPVVLAMVVCVAMNAPLADSDGMTTLPLWRKALTVALTLFITIYTWKKKHGLFVRTGIVMLYSDVKEYKRSNEHYRQQTAERLSKLSVQRRVAQSTQAHTVIMVIGESGCRDFMSVYREQPWMTTPWQSQKREQDAGFIFFDHAYSCAMQTVPSLERALTEMSQYNDKEFAQSCSIVDIAHKAGYRVHWYSNQGHIGYNDTPVTLVAETADVAKWTKQEVGKPQYDASLVSFMDEIDPEQNNFVVLHLKGSHFNYNNRYPADYAAANALTDGDDVHCYRNSIHYTDHILHDFFDYASTKLHLAAMVYFSDHGAMPDTRRSPRFLGFGMVRIPLWVYLSADYAEQHQQVKQALMHNKDKYFTNDMAYELMCGIFDIRSEHYDETASLASDKYMYTRDMLLTDEGRVRVADDTQP